MKNGLSEIRLFLKNHSLEFHKIWHENTLEKLIINWSIEEKMNFNIGNSRYASERSTGIIKDLSVKIFLK